MGIARPIEWLKLPIWVGQLLTGAKSFVDNPLIGSVRLNRAGLYRARVRFAHRMTGWRRDRLASMLPATLREAFDRDGCVVIPDFMPAHAFAALKDALYAHGWPAREMVQGNAVTRRFAVNPAMLAEVPALRALMDDDRWRGLSRYVAGYDCEPLLYIQTIVSHVGAGDDDPQLSLHIDAFQPSMKAWLFLDDVALEDGPFAFVTGSHRLTPKLLDWQERRALEWPKLDRLSQRGSLRIDESELAALDLPPPTRFAVPANTLVVGDTCGFHGRSPSSRPSVRVEIWAYHRRNPFLPWTGFDFLGGKGVAERRIDWFWRIRDWLAARKLWNQPWTPVGIKRPQER